MELSKIQKELQAGTADASMTNDIAFATAAVFAEPWMARIEGHPYWEVLSQLRITLHAAVTLNRFRVKDLINLKGGQVFESISPATDDVALLAGHTHLGWGEFEVLDQRIAVRLTRLG